MSDTPSTSKNFSEWRRGDASPYKQKLVNGAALLIGTRHDGTIWVMHGSTTLYAGRDETVAVDTYNRALNGK